MDWSDFHGVNRAQAEELYEQFLRDPSSVDPKTRAVLKQLPAPPKRAQAQPPQPSEPQDLRGARTVVGALNLIQSLRRYGHLAANIDPLGGQPIGDATLDPATHGVTEADLRALPASLVATPAGEGASSLADLAERMRKIYCSTTGYDFAHVFAPAERQWLREAVESSRFHPPHDPIDAVGLLDRLTRVEAFEAFLQRSFPGKTRFSIEGLDMLVPVLDEVISGAGEAGLRRAFIGMAHRGRLNVMAHVMGKPYDQFLAEFKDQVRHASEMIGVQWTGDVKYHMGASHMIADGEEVELVVSMPPNPSHLEAIDPVLEGMARAAGTEANHPGAPVFSPDTVLPVLVHGDAAFPGQGVVAETLNFQALAGYTTGGTIHIIANNQVGFTTDPDDSYSTLYASGLARGFKIPIVHVNADDPEACVAAARLAIGYRQEFKRDFLIDLVGYRRLGHNEGDEPAFTQPLTYREMASHPTVRQIWATTLETRGLIDRDHAASLLTARMDALQHTLDHLDATKVPTEAGPVVAPPGTAESTKTAVPIESLRAMHQALGETPGDFHVHRKLERTRERRRHAFDTPAERSIDWAAAEELAFASILADGTPIRLTGQDVGRGTFAQRHAVLHDVETGRVHIPLRTLPMARASFEVINSPLSENAAIGFEYGYNIQAPDRLVIWEAQYGDFINGAQAMVDEFLVSARAKWGQSPSLVLLLPHGHEGQGPDHASARPERILQLAADINLRLANCTTAAQYFHLLRRQAALLTVDPLPLVVLTPKSLLRHPFVSSRPIDLAEGRWQPVIDDADRQAQAQDVRRLILCSGKVAIDLLTSPLRSTSPAVAVCRVEQLYPLPVNDLVEAIERYPSLTEIMWVQEEPENMGAWDFVRPQLEGLAGRRRLAVLARPRSASPAEGSASRHAQVQAHIIARAFENTYVHQHSRS